MTNYRVRQVLALGAMPERQLRFLVALATWMSDETRVVRVGLGTLIGETGNTHNTVRKARRELEAATKLASHGGRGQGNLTVWTVLCLPEKGTSDVDPFNEEPKGTSDVDPFPAADAPPKGTNRPAEKVPIEAAERYQPQVAGQQEPEMGFDLRANPLGSISLSAPASNADGDSERENDFDEDEDEPNPYAVLLARAVPGADPGDIEWALDSLEFRKAHGEIGSIPAYLRKIIANGDAQVLVDDAGAERRRSKAIPAGYDPFGRPRSPSTAPASDPWAPAAQFTGPVVAGEVIRPDADVRLTDVPETRMSVPPGCGPQIPDWKQVECPACKAGPGNSCTNPATGAAWSTHPQRRQAASVSQAEGATP